MNNKQEIMDKALALFALEGYESVGVAKIVQESGVTKPTLYHYFGNKEGLLKSMYELYFNLFLEELNKMPVNEQDVSKTIELLTKTYIQFAKNNQLFFWLSNHLRKGPMQSESHLIVKSFHEKEISKILEIITIISSYHTNLQGNEDFLALNYMNLVNGFIEISILQDELDNIDDLQIHKLTKQFLYGIFSL